MQVRLLHNLAALGLGALLPLAFAPFDIWPLAILIPALLIWLCERPLELRQLFWRGWLFGFGYFGFGVYWIYNSLHDFGNAAPPVAAGVTGLLVVYLAVWPGLMMAFHGYARRHFGDRSLWFLPAYWFGMEWLKGWVITGMPWLSLGYSQTDTPLSGYAPLVGIYGVSAACLLMAVALYRVLKSRQFRLVAILVSVPLLGWLLQQIEWTEARGQPLRVSMVQGNIPQHIKWQYDQRQNIFNTYWRETNQLWDSDLIVWPETALPGHSEDIEASVLTPLQQVARERQTPIMTGLVVSDDANNRFYNSVMMLAEERQLYHKRHLVIFGEYYPMRWLLDRFSHLIRIPFSDLTPGPDGQPPMRVRDQLLGVTICFEDVFSRDVMVDLPAATILVNVSNDAWFGDSTAPHQHLQIARMRSLETGRPMIRSTNTGVSAFIDHRGGIESQSAQFRTESLTGDVQGRSGNTPFYYFAKLQGFLSVLPFAIVIAMVARRRA